MRVVLVIASLLLTAGCASLKVQNDDGFATAAGKVAFRLPLAVATLGISEIAIDGNADKAATAAFGDYLLGEVAAGRMSADEAGRLYAIRVAQLNAAEANRAAVIGAIAGAASRSSAPPHTYHCWPSGHYFYCQ
jgi:hypothetical protein